MPYCESILVFKVLQEHSFGFLEAHRLHNNLKESDHMNVQNAAHILSAESLPLAYVLIFSH